jgi:cell division protein FtsW
MQRKKSQTKNRLESGEFDLLLLILPLSLVAFGIIMVYSASMPYAQKYMGDPYYFLKRQFLWVILGSIALILLSRCNAQDFQNHAYKFLGISFILLILLLIPGVGRTVKGSCRWLRLGPFNIQPSELAKLALIVSLSYLLAKKKLMIKNFRYTFLPFLVILGTFFFLIASQPDLGTALVIASVGLTLGFVAGIRVVHLLGLVIVSLPLIFAFISRHGYIKARLRAFANPWQDPLNTGFQAIHSFFAFGSGGWTGVGLGMGQQKQLYLPEPHTDFIFSVIGEEFGFLGCITVLGILSLLLWRIIQLTLSVDDRFALYLVVGIGFLIAMESIINVGVVLGVFPTKGLAFPFLSYGGSAMVVNLSAIGMLISISRTTSAPI